MIHFKQLKQSNANLLSELKFKTFSYSPSQDGTLGDKNVSSMHLHESAPSRW